MFFWDVLQRTLRKDLQVNPFSIRFLPVEKHESVPYDMFMVLGLHSLWKSRMAVRHAEQHPKSARVFFIELFVQVKSVVERFETPPDWINLLEELTGMKEF